MADLDDFFAKKDRKKSKGKKIASSSELAKQLADNSDKKNDTKPKKEKQLTTITEGGVQEQVPQEDEWKEIEVEQKDYSGLKIKQLTISEEEQNKSNLGNDNDGQDGGDDDGTSAEGGDRDGPWKKMNPSTPKVVPAPVKEVEDTTKSLKYVMPIMRQLQPMKPKVKKGVLPDIKSEEFFPTLGTEKPEEVKDDTPSSFEAVKHGNRVMSVSAGAAPLSVGNRFTSLSNDTS